MKIPKTFMLGGQTITVETKDMIDNNPDIHGQALYDEQKIKMLTKLKGDYRDVVFTHELVHHILNKMGEYKLRKDERFVDLFATFLHQYMKTAE